jgi:hypothetical protein
MNSPKKQLCAGIRPGAFAIAVGVGLAIAVALKDVAVGTAIGAAIVLSFGIARRGPTG